MYFVDNETDYICETDFKWPTDNRSTSSTTSIATIELEKKKKKKPFHTDNS